MLIMAKSHHIFMNLVRINPTDWLVAEVVKRIIIILLIASTTPSSKRLLNTIKRNTNEYDTSNLTEA